MRLTILSVAFAIQAPFACLGNPPVPASASPQRTLLDQAVDLQKRDAKQAFEQAQQAADMARRAGDGDTVVEAQALLAMLLMDLGKPLDASLKVQEARARADQLGHPRAQAFAFRAEADVQERLANYEPALQAAYQALRRFEALPDAFRSAEALATVGLINFRLKRFQDAEEAWSRAYAIHQRAQNDKGQAQVLNNLGVLAKNQKDFPKALRYYTEAEAIHQRNHNQRPLCSVYNNIAVLHFEMKDFAACERYHLKALALKESLGDQASIALSCFNLADLYKDLKRFDQGRPYLERAKALTEKAGTRAMRAETYKLESDYAEAAGNPKQALALYRKFYQEKDAIFTEEAAKKAADANTRYDVERQGREIELLKKDKAVRQTRTRLILVGTLSLAAVLMLLAARFRLKVRTSRKIEQQNRELEAMDGIVQSLNREVDLPGVLDVIAARAMDLFPQADMVGLMLLDATRGDYHYVCFRGANPKEVEALKTLRLPREQAVHRYMSPDRELENGIYLTTAFETLAARETMDGLLVPKAMLSMSIPVDGQPVAFMVLDSLARADAFPASETVRLRRFREHAISALMKAQVLARVEQERGRAEQALENLQVAYRRLDEAARTDHLTGLSNRREVTAKLVYEEAQFRRYQKPCSLLILDLDHFKRINDQYGHNAGDQVLRQLGRILKQSLRAVDTAGRWGGEEFLLLLPETDLGGAMMVGSKLRRQVEETSFEYGATTLVVTLTAGVAELNATDTSLEEWIRRADTALYLGKTEGRNRVVAANP